MAAAAPFNILPDSPTMTVSTLPTGSVTTIQQRFYKAELPAITLENLDLASLTPLSIADLLATLPSGTRLGVAASYGKKCILEALAFSTESRVLLITMNGASRQAKPQKRILRDKLLCHASLEKHGFFMECLAAGLYLDLGLRIRHAFDIVSDGDRRGSMAAYKALLARARGEYLLDESVVESIFAEQPFIKSRATEFALRAWASHIAVQAFYDKPGAIDTTVKSDRELEWMCKCVRDAGRLDSLKPHYTINDVSDDISFKKGAVDLKCTRFKTRIRRSEGQHIRFKTDQGDIKGHVSSVQGRAVKVTPHSQFSARIKSVVTIGKDDPTGAEANRANLILETFKGSDCLLSSPFVRKIFFPKFPLHTLQWPQLPATQPEINFTFRQLNQSQQTAVEKCLSNKERDRQVVIVGPPGTGKTTVIAAAVHSKIAEHSLNTVWVIAQSNVAVKNVAEKLAESGFVDFKLLVSKDFHFDWHEHLYEIIRRNVIESGNFGDTIVANERLLLGSRVILCTISMLSTNRLMQLGFTKLVPVQTVIIDEASQIEAGDYLPILAQYKTTLRKMVFIGDDKQLAPYGQEDIPELKSVFEWSHLKDTAVFLDTQYRMPIIIGNFISRHVYHSKLLTEHHINTMSCCRFVDVVGGKEVRKGMSWTNEGEVKAAVQIARRYIKEGKRFKIITPYDAQRNMIEGALKTRGLAWENTVFNVDSFQGNEEDHIVVSIVRTSSPGFMVNQRRTNVMLSRCKESMMILTQRGFLQNKAVAKTLVGHLAKEHVPRTGWVTMEALTTQGW